MTGPRTGDTASQALRRWAAAFPDRLLLEVGRTQLTYADVNRAADGLAQRLLDDLGEGHQAVALRLHAVESLLIASLGVARAGKILVQIDPASPAERADFILRDCGAALLLTDVAGDEGRPPPVADPRWYSTNGSAEVERPPGPVIGYAYTSGSTGSPKGIVVPREQLARFGDASITSFAVPDGELRVGVLWAGSVGWVSSLLSGLVLIGATVVAYDVRGAGLAAFGPWLADNAVVGFVAVPTLLRGVLAGLPDNLGFPDLQYVMVNGETMTWEDAGLLLDRMGHSAALFNMYGTTETGFLTVMAVTRDTPRGSGPMPVGSPMPGQQVTVVDAAGRTLPAGEIGEIVAEGASTSLGYLNRPSEEGTFRLLSDGRHVVRTGDRGRWRSDGLLEHLGRLDDVVKVSGNRVALGEVEAALRDLPGVATAVVVATQGVRGIRLGGYVVAERGLRPSVSGLRAGLRRRLPPAMIPDRLMVVDTLPRLPGGKLDRLALGRLPEPVRLARPPSGPLERDLLTHWRDVLNAPEATVHDDFFALGGDSLLAAELITRLDAQLGIDRPVSTLIEAPTVAELAEAIGRDDAPWSSLLPVSVTSSGATLVVVHDGTGDVLFARRLAPRLGDVTVYALRPPALAGAPGQEQSLVDLATTYVRDLAKVQPVGPYRLFGVSLGGVIAFEMACQLQAAGHRVDLLALGDTSAPGVLLDPVAGRPLRTRALSRLQEVARLEPDLRRARVVELARGQLAVLKARRAADPRVTIEEQLADAASGTTRPPPALRGQFVLQHYGRMLWNYEPAGRFEGDVLLLRADGPRELPDRGWSRYVTGQVEVSDIACRHVELTAEPHLADVAAALGQALQQAVTGGSASSAHPAASN